MIPTRPLSLETIELNVSYRLVLLHWPIRLLAIMIRLGPSWPTCCMVLLYVLTLWATLSPLS